MIYNNTTSVYIVVIFCYIGTVPDIYTGCCYIVCKFLDLLFIKQIPIMLVYSFVDSGKDTKHNGDRKA